MKFSLLLAHFPDIIKVSVIVVKVKLILFIITHLIVLSCSSVIRTTQPHKLIYSTTEKIYPNPIIYNHNHNHNRHHPIRSHYNNNNNYYNKNFNDDARRFNSPLTYQPVNLRSSRNISPDAARWEKYQDTTEPAIQQHDSNNEYSIQHFNSHQPEPLHQSAEDLQRQQLQQQFDDNNQGIYARRRRVKKRRRITTTTTTTTTTSTTPEPIIDPLLYNYYDPGDYDLLLQQQNKRSTPQAHSITAIPAHLMSPPTTSTPSSSSKLHRIEAFYNGALTPAKRYYEYEQENLRKIISSELQKTHAVFQQHQQQQNRTTTINPVIDSSSSSATTPHQPIWRITRVETMKYSDSSEPNGIKNEIVILPLKKTTTELPPPPTSLYIDLITDQSYNPYSNSTVPISSEFLNTGILHTLNHPLFNDENGFKDSSKLPENKTLEISDTLAYDEPKEIPIEPSFKRNRLRYGLLNQDSIIASELNSINKNRFEDNIPVVVHSLDDRDNNKLVLKMRSTTTTRRPTTTSSKPRTTRRPSTTTTPRPSTTITPRPSTTTIQQKPITKNSPTRTSTYSTTIPTRPPPPLLTTRRNPATTTSFLRPVLEEQSLTIKEILPTTTEPIRTTTTTSTTTTTESAPTTIDSPPPIIIATTPSPNDLTTSLDDLLQFFNAFQSPESTTTDHATNLAQAESTNLNPQTDLLSQLNLLETLLGGGQQLATPAPLPISSSTSSTNNLADLQSIFNIFGGSGSTTPNSVEPVVAQIEPTPESLQSALNNMLSVLSNPFSPPGAASTSTSATNSIFNPLQSLFPTQAPQPNNVGQSSDNLLTQLLQLGNSLDANNQNTRQTQTQPTNAFDLPSLLSGSNSWLSNLIPTTTPTNPSLLDLSSLLRGGGNLLNQLTGQQSQSVQAPNPFSNLFNFGQQPSTTARSAGPYYWLDMNTFFGGNGGLNDGIRPKFGSRDSFLKIS